MKRLVSVSVSVSASESSASTLFLGARRLNAEEEGKRV
jgi:hypothetical protein